MIAEDPVLDLEEEEDDDDDKKKTPEDRKRLFRKELSAMLYGFGDVKESDEKTLETLENIVTDYIEKLCLKALACGRPNRLNLEDIYYLIRRDMKKFARVKELLSMSDELKKARRQFEECKEFQ